MIKVALKTVAKEKERKDQNIELLVIFPPFSVECLCHLH